MKLLRAVMILSLALAFSVAAKADSVLGVPVTGIGSTTQAVPTCSPGPTACYNTTTGSTTFFIPLRPSTSGTLGVVNSFGVLVGTSADTGYGTSNALTIYLLFSPVNLPVDTATLNFTFVDLDLVGGNDPPYFFETVQFFAANNSPLSPLITALGQSGSGGGYLPFIVSGGSGSQTIFFSDVTSIMEDPFYVELTFGSQWNQKGTNTPESMIATLTTTPGTPVPEPATLLLVGTGLAVGAFRRRAGIA